MCTVTLGFATVFVYPLLLVDTILVAVMYNRDLASRLRG